MAYRPYDRNPSGIVFFGATPSDQAFESNANFTIDGTTLKATNLAVSDNGVIGNTTNSNMISFGSDGQITFSSGIIVEGDLTVNGTETILNTQVLNVEDNIITLNSNATGVPPSLNAGIEIERGTSANVELRWNETTDGWEYTDDGTTYYEIATITGSETLLNKTINANNNTISNLTNSNLNGSAGITNANLANPNITLGTTTVQLGVTALTIAGLDSIQSTVFSGDLVGNANTATVALDASGLTSNVTIQLSDQLNGSATFQNAGDTATINATLTAASITGQTIATSGNDTDFILIASGTELRKITRANLLSGLGAGNMSSWDISAEGGAAGTVTQGDTVDFSGAGNITVTRDNLNIIISGEGSTYSAGSGLVLNGTTFDIQTDNSSIEIVTDTLQLTDTTVSAGSYGDPSAGSGVTLTVDAKGRLTAVANEAITVNNSNVTYSIETLTSPNTITRDVTLVSGAITVTLPDNQPAGTKRVVKRIDNNVGEVTISRQTTDTIDGTTSKLLYYQWESMTFVSDGSDWYVI